MKNLLNKAPRLLWKMYPFPRPQWLLRTTTASIFLACGAHSQTFEASGDFEPPLVEAKKTFANTAIPLVKGAIEVIVDIPSPLHPTRYQRGSLSKWIYVIYPDGTAHVMTNEGLRRNLFDVTCIQELSCKVLGADGTEFTVPATGEERPSSPDVVASAQDVARYVARWLLAGSGPGPTLQPVTLAPDVDEGQGSSETEQINLASTDAVEEPISEGNIVISPNDEANPDDIHSEVEVPVLQSPDELNASCPDVAAFVPDDCHQAADLTPELSISSRLVPPLRVREATQSQRRLPSQTTLKRAQIKEPETFFERIDLSCAITGTTSLQGPSGYGTLQFANPRTSLGCSTNLTPRLSFRFALVGYINPSDKSASDPDFTYAFSYRFSDKINLGFSNYSAQFNGTNGNFFDGLKDGNLRVGYKLPVLTLPFNKTLPCTVSVGLPNPATESLNVSCGYAVNDKLRVGGTAYLYAPGEQTTYQPDYSYTASYTISDELTISYSNFSNNRWTWNRGEAPGVGVLGGNLSVTYKFKF
ncbi:hypothetical protein [Pacificibacter marinus]|uniref:Uncharacterized protein n=1 Tax=Pacificibacter marinus TaxID=658057 RepID=A0A1Y5T417_9RHOB|nr:hypothetical protein [Pacificibacter marinus]SEL37914.1 hypothetical protein SAMN04488032_12122 [Pacificibacter marinus]SLN55350.1 hypothetical protein PAM7971_02843 [Pacificibacter marinus]